MDRRTDDGWLSAGLRRPGRIVDVASFGVGCRRRGGLGARLVLWIIARHRCEFCACAAMSFIVWRAARFLWG